MRFPRRILQIAVLASFFLVAIIFSPSFAAVDPCGDVADGKVDDACTKPYAYKCDGDAECGYYPSMTAEVIPLVCRDLGTGSGVKYCVKEDNAAAKTCSPQYLCGPDGYYRYKKNFDCSQTIDTYCTYGCDAATGTCKASPTSTTIPDSANPTISMYAAKKELKVGERGSITIVGNDDKDVARLSILYNGHSEDYDCTGIQTYCRVEFSQLEFPLGTTTVLGFVNDASGNGISSSITITVSASVPATTTTTTTIAGVPGCWKCQASAYSSFKNDGVCSEACGETYVTSNECYDPACGSDVEINARNSLCRGYASSCSGCVESMLCGWSTSQQKCLSAGVPRSTTRSEDRSTSGSQWITSKSMCPAVAPATTTTVPSPVTVRNTECAARATTCAGCVIYSLCGWSVTEKKCLSAGIPRSTVRSEDATTDGIAWVTSSSICASVAPSTPATTTTIATGGWGAFCTSDAQCGSGLRCEIVDREGGNCVYKSVTTTTTPKVPWGGTCYIDSQCATGLICDDDELVCIAGTRSTTTTTVASTVDQPPKATIVAPSTAEAGKPFTFIGIGTDDKDVAKLELSGPLAKTYACEGTQTSCSTSWTITQPSTGTYIYYLYVHDSAGRVMGASKTVTVTAASTPATCSAGYYCEGNKLLYRFADCRNIDWQTCSYGCEGNACKAYSLSATTTTVPKSSTTTTVPAAAVPPTSYGEITSVGIAPLRSSLTVGATATVYGIVVASPQLPDGYKVKIYEIVSGEKPCDASNSANCKSITECSSRTCTTIIYSPTPATRRFYIAVLNAVGTTVAQSKDVSVVTWTQTLKELGQECKSNSECRTGYCDPDPDEGGCTYTPFAATTTTIPADVPVTTIEGQIDATVETTPNGEINVQDRNADACSYAILTETEFQGFGGGRSGGAGAARSFEGVSFTPRKCNIPVKIDPKKCPVGGTCYMLAKSQRLGRESEIAILTVKVVPIATPAPVAGKVNGLDVSLGIYAADATAGDTATITAALSPALPIKDHSIMILENGVYKKLCDQTSFCSVDITEPSATQNIYTATIVDRDSNVILRSNDLTVTSPIATSEMEQAIKDIVSLGSKPITTISGSLSPYLEKREGFSLDIQDSDNAVDCYYYIIEDKRGVTTKTTTRECSENKRMDVSSDKCRAGTECTIYAGSKNAYGSSTVATARIKVLQPTPEKEQAVAPIATPEQGCGWNPLCYLGKLFSASEPPAPDIRSFGISAKSEAAADEEVPVVAVAIIDSETENLPNGYMIRIYEDIELGSPRLPFDSTCDFAVRRTSTSCTQVVKQCQSKSCELLVKSDSAGSRSFWAAVERVDVGKGYYEYKPLKSSDVVKVVWSVGHVHGTVKLIANGGKYTEVTALILPKDVSKGGFAATTHFKLDNDGFTNNMELPYTGKDSLLPADSEYSVTAYAVIEDGTRIYADVTPDCNTWVKEPYPMCVITTHGQEIDFTITLQAKTTPADEAASPQSPASEAGTAPVASSESTPALVNGKVNGIDVSLGIYGADAYAGDTATITAALSPALPIKDHSIMILENGVYKKLCDQTSFCSVDITEPSATQNIYTATIVDRDSNVILRSNDLTVTWKRTTPLHPGECTWGPACGLINFILGKEPAYTPPSVPITLGDIAGAIKINANGVQYDTVSVAVYSMEDPNDPAKGSGRFIYTLIPIDQPTDESQEIGYAIAPLPEGRYFVRVFVRDSLGYSHASDRENDCPASPNTGYDVECLVETGNPQDFEITLVEKPY